MATVIKGNFSTKRGRRRQNMLDELWLRATGDTRKPKFMARQARRALWR